MVESVWMVSTTTPVSVLMGGQGMTAAQVCAFPVGTMDISSRDVNAINTVISNQIIRISYH